MTGQPPDPLTGIVELLLDEGRNLADLPGLFADFCAVLVRGGLPVWRASLSLETLHPEQSGASLTWMEGALEQRERARAGVLTHPSYLNSPMRVVDETNRPFRRRLVGAHPDMPLLEELQGQGGTDYYIFPLPFLDTTRTAAMSFATRAAGGFAEDDIAWLTRAGRLLSPYAERTVLRRISVDLLAAYLGPAAGERVYHGQVERGEVRTIAAAVWFCDLRDFTRISERLPRRDVIDVLNRWFDAMGGAVEACGGEILKFMGDGLLAVFPIDGDARAVCDRALEAALRAEANMQALNAELRAAGGEALGFGLALHLGEIEFGNIGTRQRLDFTAIGPTVNHASRLQELTKSVGHPIVASSAFAAAAGRRLRPLGSHLLRGVDGAVEIHAL